MVALLEMGNNLLMEAVWQLLEVRLLRWQFNRYAYLDT